MAIFSLPDHWTIYTRWSWNFNHWSGWSEFQWSPLSLHNNIETDSFFFCLITWLFILSDQGNLTTDHDGQIFSDQIDHYTLILKLAIFLFPITGQFILCDQGNLITDQGDQIFTDHLNHCTIILKLAIFHLLITGQFIQGDQVYLITDQGDQIFSDQLDHHTIILKLAIFPSTDHWTIYTRW